jgi:hypothetical protein
MRHDNGARWRRALSAAIVVVGPLACGEAAPNEPVTRDTFVQVIVDLRRAAAGASSQQEFEARRAEILRQAGVSDSALVEYARVHAGELDYMSAVWDSIDARLSRPDIDTLVH